MNRFDEIINRRNTSCVKWDSPTIKYGKDNDIIPMGIADMDFKVADEIIAALNERVNQGVYGYGFKETDSLTPLIVERYNNKGYNIKPESLIYATGVVYSIDNIIKEFSKENDKIVLALPHYTPFETVIKNNHRQVLDLPMKVVNGRYEMDLNAIEDKVDENTPLFILCNPHNPTGRVFEEYELKEVADFCFRHNILIIEDEIHSDFCFAREFTPVMSVSQYAYDNSFTLTSASKTYNLAATKASFGFINNKELKARYEARTNWTGLGSLNTFGVVAMKTAYEKCGYWEKEVYEYLKENTAYAVEYIHTNIPEIKVLANEGTYLLWLDMSCTGLKGEALTEFLNVKAKVGLNSGSSYGEGYESFMRMNCALAKPLLTEALQRLKEAVHNL